MTLFVLGSIAFLICFAIMFFAWGEMEEVGAPIIIYIVSVLSLFFFAYGDSVFSSETHRWILFSCACFTALIFIIYSIYYCVDTYFEAWLLWFIPPLGLQALFIINTFFNINLGWLKKATGVVFWIAVVIVGLILIVIIWYLISERIKKHIDTKASGEALHDMTIWNTNVFTISLIGVNYEELNHDFYEIYKFLVKEYENEKHPYFKYYDIKKFIENLPYSAQKLILKRLECNEFFSNAHKIDFTAFCEFLAPEIFKQTINSTNLIQGRMFEELPSQIAKIVMHNIEKNNNTLDNTELFQTQIREVFHSLYTPIRIIMNSITIINKSKNAHNMNKFVDILEENLKRISTNAEVLSSLLYAYRGIAFSMNYAESSLTVKDFLNETLNGLNIDLEKQVSLDIDNVDYIIDGYSKNLVFALLIPLIQNAVEASPTNGVIKILQKRENDFDIIIIKNKIGDTSENDNTHEGIGIRSVQNIADNMNIDFCYSFKDDVFESTLKFPIKIKETVNV